MNIIVDSKFNPFTYKELMLPIEDYRQDYLLVETAYSDLVSLTEAWKDIANRLNSPEAYAMYKSYADLLNSVVDDFSSGMNPNNRRQLLNMKRMYASNITPIAKASEAMNAANALRDLAGSDAIFEVGRYNSLDKFLHGQTANNKFESRKDIASRTAALALATAQSIMEDPIIKNSMSPLFLEVIQKKGIGSLQELQLAIAGNPAAANRFAQIRNQMIGQLGGLDRFDDAGRTAVEGAINEGLYAGLNNYLTSLQLNGEYMTRAQRAADARQAAQLSIAQQEFQWKQQDRNRALGKEPLYTNPDGTRVFSNGYTTWTETPNQATRTKDGKLQYKYTGSDGKDYWYDKPGYKVTPDKVKLTPAMSGTYTRSAPTKIADASASAVTATSGKGSSKATIQNPTPKVGTTTTGSKTGSGTKTTKLGQIIGVEFPMVKGPNYGYVPGTKQLISKDDITQATPITGGYDRLETAEQHYIDSEVPEVAANHDAFNYYYVYYDKDGKVVGKNDDKAVKKQLVLKDK